MNKLLTSAVAGVAGITLLLGGAGTFALWNSQTTLPGGTIAAGNLVVMSDGAPGTWTDQNESTIDVSTFRAAPGDSLTYTKTMSITATGDNLRAVLVVDPAIIVAAADTVPADLALADYLVDNATLDASGAGVSEIGDENARSDGSLARKYLVTAGVIGVEQNVTVAVHITFPSEQTPTSAAEAGTKAGSVTLQDMLVSLTQL